jgi:hypothetical protein
MGLGLLDAEHRRTGGTTRVTNIFKVYQGELRASDHSMSLRRMPAGTIAKATS